MGYLELPLGSMSSADRIENCVREITGGYAPKSGYVEWRDRLLNMYMEGDYMSAIFIIKHDTNVSCDFDIPSGECRPEKWHRRPTL